MNLSSEMRIDPMAADNCEDDVRWEKVRALREALAAGTYSVSAEALAERLMDRMREE